MFYFKIVNVSKHLSEGVAENNGKPQTGNPVLGLRIEIGTSGM
jgi:hypothetical protein